MTEVTRSRRALSFYDNGRITKMTKAQRSAVPSHRAGPDAYTPRERTRGRAADTVPPLPGGTHAGRGGGSRVGGFPAPSPHVGPLIAEWLVGVVLICIGIPLGGNKGYTKTMTDTMMRLTALTGVFFFLSLVGTSPKANKATIYFGALVDLGILYTSISSGTMQQIANVFSGNTGSNGPHVVLAGDVTSSATPASGQGFGDLASTTDSVSMSGTLPAGATPNTGNPVITGI